MTVIGRPSAKSSRLIIAAMAVPNSAFVTYRVQSSFTRLHAYGRQFPVKFDDKTSG